jgi:hypothetical protein
LSTAQYFPLPAGQQMTMTDEEQLIAKLQHIEALFARPTTEAERLAAPNAIDCIRARLRAIEQLDPAVEYRFSLPDPWSHRLMIALLRRYGIDAYRYQGQRRYTIMIRASLRFIEETLWPEFEQLRAELVSYFEAITQRVLSQALEVDLSDLEK